MTYKVFIQVSEWMAYEVKDSFEEGELLEELSRNGKEILTVEYEDDPVD